MYYHVFVGSRPDQSYLATVLGWPECVGVGSTKEEAVANVRTAIADRLAHGEIVRIQVGALSAGDPWERLIGQFADDPHWNDFQEELHRIRYE